MAVPVPNTRKHPGAAARVRKRIESGGERLWRMEDFRDLPFTAVAQTLSRLSRNGQIERLSKGIYFRARQTSLGVSRPNPTDLQALARGGRALFPAGIAAANLLGFTTQSGRTAELATTRSSLPRKLVGTKAVIQTRRPEAWNRLSDIEAALLDFLRRGGLPSELPPAETAKRLLVLLEVPKRFKHLLAAAASEPPRVRALLGALGEQLGRPPKELLPLRKSLNPFSRFDFGVLSILPNARAWQAKEQRS